jgi:TolA-binding protein
MAAGQFAEAEAVYRADLKKLPANGWSLYGLAECLGAQGRKAEAEKVHAEFLQTWVRADMTITSSCLCFPKL